MKVGTRLFVMPRIRYGVLRFFYKKADDSLEFADPV
jgi:hypothetical protein